MEIKATEAFEKSLAKLYKKDKYLLDTLEEFMKELQINSSLGVHLGNNRYKIRLQNRSANKGKSAGYRIITYTKIEDTVVLVYIYSKSKTETISDKKIDNIIANYKL
ncbi:MAG: hypothetical protein KU38_05470 [Sulfurovum sp. FS08-3]|nr:MAG: hypothetical protein KU38_05470 [Sulfurovum sp. FS08-3]